MLKVYLSKPKMCRCIIVFLTPFAFLLCPWVASPEEPLKNALPTADALEEELKYLHEETYVITPSKIPQRIEKAPGVIYVVTDQMIRQMGARYLSDVMETVPGWVLREDFFGMAVMSVTGVSGNVSNYILIMVNSLIVNDPNNGSGWFYQFLELDNVKRIEFVTGPGSSLYGSNAMGGVVNIITKDGKDVDGLQLTGRGGSYNTWEGNTLFGKAIEGLEVAAYLDYLNTEGFQGHVDQDSQSVWDQNLGTHASLAPGNMKGDADQWDAQLTMKYKWFKFDGKYLDRKRDMPFGYFPKLDDRSDFNNQQYYLNLGYDETIMEGLNLTAKVYRNQYMDSQTGQLSSKGTLMLTPSGPTIISDDMYFEWKTKSRRTGAEAQTTYEIWDANTIVGGISFEQMESYDNETKGNYLPTPSWGTIIPLPSVEVFPESMQQPNKKRNLWAAYVEDLWDIVDDLRLTIGGRYDHYSDVGGQFSPRVGLNWDFAQNYYAKFLYGKSFRAPTFTELYRYWYGNPDLKPMTKDSYQLSFGLRFLPSFSAELTGFYYQPKDTIGLVSVGNEGFYKYINFGETKNKGVQLQMKYDFGGGTYLSMNYTYVDLELWDNNQQPVAVWWEPTRFGTLSANVRLNRYLNLNTYLLYRGGWARANNDTREDPGDYAIVNATLIARNFLRELEGLEVRAAVKNLLNKDYTSPTAQGELPDDMPMPGINFFLEMRYTF